MVALLLLTPASQAFAFSWSANGTSAGGSGRNFSVTLAPGATAVTITAIPGSDKGDHVYMRYTFNNALAPASVPPWWTSSQNPWVDWTGDGTWEWRDGGTQYSKTIGGLSPGTFRVIVECQNYDWSASFLLTVRVPYPNAPPTVSLTTLPPTLYTGNWFPVRATGRDADGNLGGVWVEFRVNAGGAWSGWQVSPMILRA